MLKIYQSKIIHKKNSGFKVKKQSVLLCAGFKGSETSVTSSLLARLIKVVIWNQKKTDFHDSEVGGKN